MILKVWTLKAVNILQSIPAKQRSAKISLALGKLYHQNGMERPAIAAYRYCTDLNVGYNLSMYNLLWEHKVGMCTLHSRVECGIFFWIGQNRSSKQRSGMILEVQFQNLGAWKLMWIQNTGLTLEQGFSFLLVLKVQLENFDIFRFFEISCGAPVQGSFERVPLGHWGHQMPTSARR